MRSKGFLFRLISVSLFSAYLFVLFSPEQNAFSVKADTTANWVEGKAECVMEINSRRILYESNGDSRLPMASTTKIITAITVLEHCSNLQEEINIPKEAVGIEGSSVYLKEGDKYSVENLLYGLMLRSGNDCATALALYCSGSVNNFSVAMNQTAQKAGALASNFKNPHGLPCINHYTTARDLSYITCYAMQNQTFKEIVSTQYYSPKQWCNKNKLLQLYNGGMGVKTGYTKEAGRCLVSAANKQNMTLVCTLLNCPTTYERTIKLLDDAFETYDYTCILEENTPLKVGTEGDIMGYSKESYYYPLLKEEKEWIEIKTIPVKNTVQKKYPDEIIGQFEIYLAKQLLFLGNLYKL